MVGILLMLAHPVGVSGSSGSKGKVIVAADGSQWEWVSNEATVGGILREAGINLGVKDRVTPTLDTRAVPGMKIAVTRIEERIVTQREAIKFDTVTRLEMRSTKSGIIQTGQNGEKEVKYLVTLKNGVRVASKPLSSWVVKKPVDQVVIVSHPNQLSSRGGYPVRRIRMVATAYAPFHCGGSRSGHCALGMMATKGIVAVDPRVIRLGMRVYVEGYGVAIAADTGGAIKGSRIDLCFDTDGESIRYGRRAVNVYILD